MNYAEYSSLHEQLAAYRKAVIERASNWLTENMPAFPIDNTMADPDAYNLVLAEKIGVLENGQFLVWLNHNSSENTVHRVGVPAEILDVPELTEQ